MIALSSCQRHSGLDEQDGAMRMRRLSVSLLLVGLVACLPGHRTYNIAVRNLCEQSVWVRISGFADAGEPVLRDRLPREVPPTDTLTVSDSLTYSGEAFTGSISVSSTREEVGAVYLLDFMRGTQDVAVSISGDRCPTPRPPAGPA